MLRAEDNKFLTESGPGTGMGELLRRFWIPVLLSEELPEPDGEPKKIIVLGEELLAFRDSRGVVGLIDQYCPHRGANLWLGRNEECGIRCVYHGWKFDTDGRCVDMPTSYPDLNAKDLIRIKSYPAREWGEMIWAYMGPADAMPELPDLEMALLPASHRYVSKKWQDCNWVQALEGSIDTAHFTFAHLSFDKEENEILDIKKHFVNPIARMSSDHMRWIAEDPRPVIKIAPHAAGLTIAGGRLTGRDDIYWRIAQFLMPFHAYAPSAMPGENIFGQTFVPVTDTNCWIYTYAWNPERPLTQAERDAFDRGNGVIAEVGDNYVPLRHKGNDYLIDRKLQKTRSYTGIKGVSEQDAAVQDSQRPIADRTREHLGPTDLGIMHFRKVVMELARALQQGEPPPQAAHQDRYAVRSGACVTSKTKDLSAVMLERFGDVTGFVGRPRTAAAE
ncbi:phthalate 4,5-dioxygenase oxygenase subunit [Bradyrhizobium sp. JR4.1]|uniref:Rieske 2Fe-2S domain-containing protein n=1 Tax=Bradyrhizobium sp. JR4.1 TaxID=3156372 RepID=UPI0033926186